MKTKCINNNCPKKEFCETYNLLEYVSRAVYQFVDFKGLVVCDYFEQKYNISIKDDTIG